MAKQKVTNRFGSGQWSAFNQIVSHESAWNPNAVNKRSGSCGLPQALPCSKLPHGLKSSPGEQIDWMIDYIADRYGTPNHAWSFWLKHRWY